MSIVGTQIVDRVRHIELRRPEKRNAIAYETLAELHRLLPAPEDRDVIGVVLSGQGEHFSAGADLGSLTGTAKDKAFDDEMERITRRISDAPVPIVAAVSGYCFGAAVDLVMACDVRVADRSATFRVPAVHLGLLYNPAALARMARGVRPDVLHRLFVLAEVLGAADATAAGLVSILTDDAPRDQAHRLLVEGADRDPDAVAQTRQLLRALSTGEQLDEQRWAGARHRLLESRSRKDRVTQARKRKATLHDNSG